MSRTTVQKKEREDVMVGIRMPRKMRDEIVRYAEKKVVPYTIFARMLLREKLDQIKESEEK